MHRSCPSRGCGGSAPKPGGCAAAVAPRLERRARLMWSMQLDGLRTPRAQRQEQLRQPTRRLRVGYGNIIRRGQNREDSGCVRSSLREQQRTGRRGQVSKVRFERALVAGMGWEALPAGLSCRGCGPGTLDMGSFHDGLA